jgi:caffeoyl-CoA O-methyltransferase
MKRGGNMKADVCIVGAGPHGLAAAKSLIDKGWSVTVLEREVEMDSRRNTMLIQPGGMQVLKELDVIMDVDQETNRMLGYDYYVDGERLVELRYEQLEDSPFPYALGVPYRMLQRAFLNKLNKDERFCLLKGIELKGILKDVYGKTNGVLINQEGEKKTIEARIIIAADGVNSPIRQFYGISTQAKTWDYEAITFLLPRPHGWPSVLSNYRSQGNHYLGVAAYNPEELSILWGIKSGSYHELKECGIKYLCDQIVQMEPRLADVYEHIRSWDDVELRSFKGLMAETWVGEGMMLIGSSAHSLTTFGGQNMNLALYDAREAANVADEALKRNVTHANFLKTYENRRRPLVERIAQFQEASAAPKRNNSVIGYHQPTKKEMAAQLKGMFRTMALGPSAGILSPEKRSFQTGQLEFSNNREIKIYHYDFGYDTALNWIWKQTPKNDPLMAEMGMYALQHKVPVIGPVSGRLLTQLTKMTKAKRVFEFGSAIGYSTIYFARGLGEDGKVYYTEKDTECIKKAKYFIKKAGLLERIEFLEGDALYHFEQVDGEFDIILCDIDKSLYPKIFEKALPRLKKGGLFIADNIFWRGTAFDPGSSENDPSIAAIQKVTEDALHAPSLFSTIIPVGDGLLVGYKE